VEDQIVEVIADVADVKQERGQQLVFGTAMPPAFQSSKPRW
jgi:hypothetical protein